MGEIIHIVFIVFAVSAGIQVLKHLLFYLRVVIAKQEDVKSADIPVSVVIAARNEEDNLTEFIPKLMEQKGVEFEVIVVDDCSFDHTQDMLRIFQEKYSNFSYSVVKENRRFYGGKKFALTMGIKAAKYENLVFIDADCYPASEYWLAEMANSLQKRNIVLGYGAYEKQSTMLNFFIRFDTFLIAINYMGFAVSKLPYMGVGRNLGYKSFLFFENKGFASHKEMRSGDDDLFINEVATGANTTINFNSNSYTYSIPENTWKDWVNQKKRHISTAKKYRLKHKFLLTILPLSLYSFYGSFFVLLCSQFDWRIVLIIFGVHLIIQQLIYFLGLKKAGELDLFAVGVIFDVFYMIFYPFVVIVNVIEKCNEWKR